MSLPPGSKAPRSLQLVKWILDPMGYMNEAARQYGDIFAVPAISRDSERPAIFVSHPEGLQHLLSRDRGQDFTAPGEMNSILEPIVGDRSLILLSDRAHQRQRKLLMPPFHGDRMKTYGDTIREISDRVMATLPHNRVFKMRSVMQNITLQVIMQAVFGLESGERYRELKPLLTQLTEFTSTPLNSSVLFFNFLQKDWGKWSPWGRMMATKKRIDELLYAEIRERRQQDCGDRQDILSLMLRAQDEHGEGMSDRELHDELVTLLFAGHETTASALAWAFYWLHQNPAISAKLLAELRELGPNPDSLSLYKLPYLTAVCSETLRIYPVGMLTFFRQTTQTVDLMGYHLPPLMPIAACIYLAHRRPETYPNPEQFRPERFLERDFSPYEFLPFGAGARRCIGSALALYEMKLVLATVLSRYSLALCEKRPVQPQRRGVTLTPATGVRMKITEVKAKQAIA